MTDQRHIAEYMLRVLPDSFDPNGHSMLLAVRIRDTHGHGSTWFAMPSWLTPIYV